MEKTNIVKIQERAGNLENHEIEKSVEKMFAHSSVFVYVVWSAYNVKNNNNESDSEIERTLSILILYTISRSEPLYGYSSLYILYYILYHT